MESKHVPQGVIGTTDDFLRTFFMLCVTPFPSFSVMTVGNVGMDGLI